MLVLSIGQQLWCTLVRQPDGITLVRDPHRVLELRRQATVFVREVQTECVVIRWNISFCAIVSEVLHAETNALVFPSILVVWTRDVIIKLLLR